MLTNTLPIASVNEEMTTITDESIKLQQLEKQVAELTNANTKLQERFKSKEKQNNKVLRMPSAQLDKLMRFVKIEIFPHVKQIPQDQ